MSLRPPRTTRTDTLVPDTTIFRSRGAPGRGDQRDDLRQPVHAGAAGAGLVFGRARPAVHDPVRLRHRSEEHTSELQSLMRISYAVFCLKQKQIYSPLTITTVCMHILSVHSHCSFSNTHSSSH